MTPPVMLALKTLALFSLSALAVQAESGRPNIILILTDDQGYGDISAHGSPDVSTPNMDQLKAQGVSLEDFLVSPTCAPTRSALMTGRHPFKNGTTHTILERERMALGVTTLPEVLKRANYTSGIFGKWHLGDEPEYQPESRGFDEVFIFGSGGIGQAWPGSCADVPGNTYFATTFKHNGTFVKGKGFCTDVIFSQALSWIKEKSKEDQPFFVYLAPNAPHLPFHAPQRYLEKFAKLNYFEGTQGYYGMIENLDDNLGRLMGKLDDWELSNNTILIFMTDNGRAAAASRTVPGRKLWNAGMKGVKASPHQGGNRVPFFIRWPGHFEAGKQIDVMQNHYDLLPTFADISGIDISDLNNLDGESFLPWLKNETVESRNRYRFVHMGMWLSDAAAIKEAKRKGKQRKFSRANSKFKNCAVRNERFRFVNNKLLFDLDADPGETKNVISQYPEVVAEMRKAYNEWWDTVQPLMINENVPLGNTKHFVIDYNEQKESAGIKGWVMPDLN